MNIDYEKKYEAMVQRAREFHKAGNALTKKQMEIVCPELAESEDEKNANALIRLLNDDKITSLITYEAKQQWLNWLERKRTPSVSFDPPVGFDSGSAVVYHNEESEDERMLREFNDWLCEEIECRTNDLRDEKDRRTLNMLCYILTKVKGWLEKQKEIPMPDSTELIEMWDKEKAMLEEKGFRGDTWRIAYNAFMDGFAKGTCVKFEKQKEQKPADEQDYSGLSDLERAIHRGFLCAGVDNVPVAIIKETAQECLAQIKPAEWSEEDENKLNHILEIVHIASGSEASVSEKEELESFLKSLSPQQNPSWSEEDEEALDMCLDAIPKRWKTKSGTLLTKWLKDNIHLKQQWSEEDGKMLKNVLFVLESYVSQSESASSPSLITTYPTYYKEIDWLKSLRPSWKPSEEQMEALKYINEYVFLKDSRKRLGLRTLYQDLKKLI